MNPVAKMGNTLKIFFTHPAEDVGATVAGVSACLS
jgi:hypothetical protein